MDKKEIKSIWIKLTIPFIIGLIILTTAILFHRLGSKRPGPQTMWLFVGILGAVFTFFPGIQLVKFRRFLRNKDVRKSEEVKNNSDNTN